MKEDNQLNKDFDRIEKELRSEFSPNSNINKSKNKFKNKFSTDNKEFKKISEELERQEKELIDQLNIIKESNRPIKNNLYSPEQKFVK